MVSLVTLALCAALQTPTLRAGVQALRVAPPVPYATWLEAPDRHVRTLDRHVQWLMARGLEHSATFAALVAELAHSDVIVYIQPAPDLPSSLCGRLFLLPNGTNQRYLRIQVRLDGLSPKDAVALMAHELQHAVEVSRAREVRDAKALASLYARIGDRGLGPDWYETAAAQRTERKVLLELRG